MRRFTASCAALLLAGSLAGSLAACGGPVRNAQVPAPAKRVELSRYLGRWYEVARYDHQFEDGCEGVTADYGLREGGGVSVTNTCRKGAPNGPAKRVVFRAKVVPGSNGAKLKVAPFAAFYVGDYWVLDRGDAYDWAVVGEGSGRFLWLLARKPLDGEAREALVARARALGYDTAPLHLTLQPPAE